jgi:cytidine deaminase
MGKKLALSDLADPDRRLVFEAQKVSEHAYAPYSGFAVGAAVRTRRRKIYTGANLENAAYGVTMCAEVAALTLANSAGDFDVEAIAVVGHKFKDAPDASQVVTPCGRCRQLITEAAQLAQRPELRVICCNGELTDIVEFPISELLPEAFGPHNLGLVDRWPILRDELQARVRQLIGLRSRA